MTFHVRTEEVMQQKEEIAAAAGPALKKRLWN